MTDRLYICNNKTILILLIVILLILFISYYIKLSIDKHSNVIERFNNLQIYQNNVELRDCQVYFTTDIEGCDNKYNEDPDNTCKYKFEGWKESQSSKEANNNNVSYANKIYINGNLNESSFTNVIEDTRCFHPLTNVIKDSRCLYPLTNKNIEENNIYTLNNSKYIGKDLYPFNIDDNICSIVENIHNELKDKIFYKFILNDDNILIDIKKVSINKDQNGFDIDNNFNINIFTKKQEYGLAYSDGNKFNIFQVTSYKILDIKIYAFRYNYLCHGTQIKAFRSMDGKLLRGNFIDFSNQNITLSYGNNLSYININNNNWNGFKNPSREQNKYYQITDKIQDINKTLKENIDKVFKIRKDRLVQNKADIDNLEKNLIPIRATNTELRVRYINKYGSIEGFVDYDDLDYDDDLDYYDDLDYDDDLDYYDDLNYYQKVFYSLIKSLFDIIGGKNYFVIEGFRRNKRYRHRARRTSYVSQQINNTRRVQAIIGRNHIKAFYEALQKKKQEAAEAERKRIAEADRKRIADAAETERRRIADAAETERKRIEEESARIKRDAKKAITDSDNNLNNKINDIAYAKNRYYSDIRNYDIEYDNRFNGNNDIIKLDNFNKWITSINIKKEVDRIGNGIPVIKNNSKVKDIFNITDIQIKSYITFEQTTVRMKGTKSIYVEYFDIN